MGDRINIQQHCSSIAKQPLRESCEYLAQQCVTESQRGVREYTLQTPGGSYERVADLDACLEMAKTIPNKEGALPEEIIAPDSYYPRSRFRLKIQEGYHHLRLRPELEGKTPQGVVSYNGNFTQICIGANTSDTPNFDIVVGAVGRYSWLPKVNVDGFSSLHSYYLGMDVSLAYYFKPQSIGVHLNLGGGLDYLKASAFTYDQQQWESIGYLGMSAYVGPGLSLFGDRARAFAYFTMGGAANKEKEPGSAVDMHEEVPYKSLFLQGYMLGLSFDVPSLFGIAQDKIRRRGDQILEKHGMK